MESRGGVDISPEDPLSLFDRCGVLVAARRESPGLIGYGNTPYTHANLGSLRDVDMLELTGKAKHIGL